MEEIIKAKKVVALGDSITYGYPFTSEVSWVEALGNVTGWQVINSGISGDTLIDMADRLDRDVLRYEPQLVIVMGGTNDLYLGFSRTQMEDAFLQIMTRLKKANIQCWIGLPLPVTDSTERSLHKWREWLLSYARKEGLKVINFQQDFLDEQGGIREDLLLDGCHPSLRGYQIMGERINKFVADLS